MLEQDLYEEVTTYVREGMNRAAKLDGKRKNTVGFALTVLQRRLASSPEAIYRSLVRRAERLERWKQQLLDGEGVRRARWTSSRSISTEFDDDEFTAEELSRSRRNSLTPRPPREPSRSSTSSLLDLARLIEHAKRVRAAETDRKWSELRTILEDETLDAG